VVISRSKANSTRTRSNTLVLEEPEPADGWVNYDIYLANNLKEPEMLKEKEPGMRGEVELSFEVNKLGEPVNITVKKSLCEACDKEAIRLVREGPKWKRKAKKGKVTVMIPF
jgi:outer membrane biosynthesis protein TonB